MAVTLRFQSTGSIPGNGDPVTMRASSLTLGRGAENDLVLPDPDRVLSKRHCAIEDHNGNVVVVDFSTNGTFLNYGKIALGATPTPLNNGDILSVGPYEIQVDIASTETADVIAEPVSEGPVSHGFAMNAPTNSELLDAPGDGGDFLDDLLGGRDGPVGPGSVDRSVPDDDGLLPPLGDEDDILPPAGDPFASQGASDGMHSPSGQDHFSAPRASSGASSGGAAIPDDWDDDFLSPTPQPKPAGPSGTAEDPFAEASGAGAAAFIPDDFGLTPASEDPAPSPTPIAEEPAPAPVASEPAAPASDDPIADILMDAPEPSEDPAPEDPTPEDVVETAAPEPEPVVETATTPAVVSNTPAADDTGASRAFLKSLGAEEFAISEQDLTPTLSRMGHVLRIMIEGLREILMTRTSIKSEFRIEQTMIMAGGNNPLKFSISPEQAIEAMVKPKAKGYLDATEATTQALQDIKAHEVAMITGMEAALKGVLARLEPSVLEGQIETKGGFSNLLKSKKARYWEIYETMFAEISDQAENDFHDLFAKEFARAYQDQLDKLK